ncbi:MAG: Hsp33 family molecular chaperone HslO [Myxococcales bacterium]|nr:Hsp33 family molecular chaperone HslO [Myxococcales bacterium]
MNDLAQHDTALRAMTDDGGFRVITVCTTESVRGVLKAQGVTGDEARLLADLVTGTVLLRETMAPSLRVQGIVQTVAATLLADVHPDGGNRGLVQRPRRTATDLKLLEVPQLTMTRSLPNGGQQKGTVLVPAEGGINAALMAYMRQSEQVIGVTAVGTVFDGDEVVSAGGYHVQLTPELTEDMLAIMTLRLDDFAPIETLLRTEDGTPRRLLEELLYRMPYTLLADSPLSYQCRCDAARLLGSLASLPQSEIESLIDEGQTLEITCDYCKTEYRITVDQLRGILAPS